MSEPVSPAPNPRPSATEDAAAPFGASFAGNLIRGRESRSSLPVILAIAIVVVTVGILLAISGHLRGAGSQPSTAAYAAQLSITQIAMSTSGNLGGGQETFLDGTITNNGRRTVTAVTVQVLFRSYTNEVVARDILPVTLIRFRQPYVDVEPVSVAPIAPGEARQFRVAFDAVPDSWNQAYPAVHIADVRLQ